MIRNRSEPEPCDTGIRSRNFDPAFFVPKWKLSHYTTFDFVNLYFLSEYVIGSSITPPLAFSKVSNLLASRHIWKNYKLAILLIFYLDKIFTILKFLFCNHIRHILNLFENSSFSIILLIALLWTISKKARPLRSW